MGATAYAFLFALLLQNIADILHSDMKHFFDK